MPFKSALFLLFASLPLLAQGAWVDSSGKSRPDTESMRSDGDFGVQIVLTADEAQFRQSWNTQKTPPKLSTTDSVRAGGSVSAMLVFHGCTPAPTGHCDVAAEFTLEEPGGKQVPAGGGPVWSGRPMQRGMLQLGQASLTLGFDKTDLPGDYRVTARVKDRVSGRMLPVSTRFNLLK